MDYKQRDLLKGFYAHCYAANHGGGFLESGFWMEQLDSAKIPWFIQNAVANTATKKSSIELYFNTLLTEIVNNWEALEINETKKRYILQAPNGAFYTGQAGFFICSFEIDQAQLLTYEKAHLLKSENLFLDFSVLDLPEIKISEHVNHFNGRHWFEILTFDGEEVSEPYDTLSEAQNEYKRLLKAA